eukprot:2550127-Ditylum_brightwellii.AAC.1
MCLEFQSSITTTVGNSVQTFSTSITSMVEASFKQKMVTEVQPSLDWIKSQIIMTNNSMAMLQSQTIQTVTTLKEENSKIIEQVREEGKQRDINTPITMNKIHKILEGMKGIQPQASLSSVNQQQDQGGEHMI